jgi:hypothetical protein
MTRTALTRAAASIAAALALAVLLGGCAPKAAAPAQQQSATAAAAIEIPRMTAAEKQSLIATSFPVQVPVPQGRVLRGEAQGEDAWDYQIEIAAAPSDVAGFYTGWLGKADWQLVGDKTQGDTRTLTLVKGGAESRIIIKPAGQGTTSASVVLGVGAPVLNTQ